MTDEDLAEKVYALERRVEHLERELGTDYEQYRFVQNVEEMFPDGAEIEFRDGHYGEYARVVGINGDDVEIARQQLEGGLDYGYAVTETAESGLGMEIWSDPDV